MSDWFIQQSGFSSDKVLGPLTSEQVVALFVRGEINKKTPLASQQHTGNEWVLIKDSALWPTVQETLQEEKEKKARQAAALKQQQEEKKRQQEQERKDAENQRQQQRQQQQQQQQQQQLAIQQAVQAAPQVQAMPMQPGQVQHGKLVTKITGGEITAVMIAGTILEIVGGLAVAGGVIMLIIGIVAAGNADAAVVAAGALTTAIVMSVSAILYGLLMIGLGAAMKVFGRMGRLLEQNTLTLLRLLERS